MEERTGMGDGYFSFSFVAAVPFLSRLFYFYFSFSGIVLIIFLFIFSFYFIFIYFFSYFYFLWFLFRLFYFLFLFLPAGCHPSFLFPFEISSWCNLRKTRNRGKGRLTARGSYFLFSFISDFSFAPLLFPLVSILFHIFILFILYLISLGPFLSVVVPRLQPSISSFVVSSRGSFLFFCLYAPRLSAEIKRK